MLRAMKGKEEFFLVSTSGVVNWQFHGNIINRSYVGNAKGKVSGKGNSITNVESNERERKSCFFLVSASGRVVNKQKENFPPASRAGTKFGWTGLPNFVVQEGKPIGATRF